MNYFIPDDCADPGQEDGEEDASGDDDSIEDEDV